MPVQSVPDAASWAEKMLRRVAGAGPDWEKGVQNPSSSPVAGMKKAKTRWKNQMQAAIAGDFWGKAVDRLTDDEIVAGALAVGGGAFTNGIAARAQKVRDAIARLQPKVQALKAKLDAMPVDTDAQREAKMIEAKRGMEAIGRELSGTAR